MTTNIQPIHANDSWIVDSDNKVVGVQTKNTAATFGNVTATTNPVTGGIEISAGSEKINAASLGAVEKTEAVTFTGIGKNNISYWAVMTANGPASVDDDGITGVTVTTQSGMWCDITFPDLYAPRLAPSAMYVDMWAEDWSAVGTLAYYFGDSAFTNYWYRAYNNNTSSFNAAPAMAGSGWRRLYADSSSYTIGGGAPVLASTVVQRHKIRITPEAGRVAKVKLGKVVYDVVDTPNISITFDDGYSSVITNALSLLNARGLKASFGVIADQIGTIARYCTLDQLKQWNSYGHECVVHGPIGGTGNVTNSGTIAGSIDDMRFNRNYLIANGLADSKASNTYIWPQGVYYLGTQSDPALIDAAAADGFTHGRSTIMPAYFSKAVSAGDYQRYALPIIGHNNAGGSEAANITAILAKITELAANKKSGILMFHEVGNAGAGALDISIANFTTVMNAVALLVAQGAITNKLFSRILD